MLLQNIREEVNKETAGRSQCFVNKPGGYEHVGPFNFSCLAELIKCFSIKACSLFMLSVLTQSLWETFLPKLRGLYHFYTHSSSGERGNISSEYIVKCVVWLSQDKDKNLCQSSDQNWYSTSVTKF